MIVFFFFPGGGLPVGTAVLVGKCCTCSHPTNLINSYTLKTERCLAFMKISFVGIMLIFLAVVCVTCAETNLPDNNRFNVL
jgi:hypothetical protein